MTAPKKRKPETFTMKEIRRAAKRATCEDSLYGVVTSLGDVFEELRRIARRRKRTK